MSLHAIRSSTAAYLTYFIRIGLLVALSQAQAASIVGFSSGKCLQVDGIPQNGSHVIQASCTGTAEQQWEVDAVNINSQYIAFFRTPSKSYMLQATADRQLVISDSPLNSNSQIWTQFQLKSRDGHAFSQWRNVGQIDSCIAIDGDLAHLPSARLDGTRAIIFGCGQATELFAEVFIDITHLPSAEPVVCSAFDDGYNSATDVFDAIFFSGRPTGNEKGKACVPGGQYGQCRKWFGMCRTVKSFQSVSFRVFNDGAAAASGASDAVYVPASGNSACVPDSSSTGNCRRWFGLGFTRDGRHVSCSVFDDGYTNASWQSDAFFVPSPIPNAGKACIPDGTSDGHCRRWFGQCRTQ